MFYKLRKKSIYEYGASSVFKKTELAFCTRFGPLHRMIVKQTSGMAFHEFNYAKFDRSDTVDRMCQSSQFELLDLLDGTVMVSYI